MAETTIKLCQGSPRLAETMFGWSRAAVELGMHELRSGITCLDNYQARGNHRSEVRQPELEAAIHELVAEHSQADARLKPQFGDTRIGAERVRRALIEHKGYQAEDLPTARTVRAILNRLGYRLQSVQKTKPQKKYLKRTPFSPMLPPSTGTVVPACPNRCGRSTTICNPKPS